MREMRQNIHEYIDSKTKEIRKEVLGDFDIYLANTVIKDNLRYLIEKAVEDVVHEKLKKLEDYISLKIESKIPDCIENIVKDKIRERLNKYATVLTGEQ